jgi:hypothetical protein
MAGTEDEFGSTQIFKYRGILTLTDTTLMFAFLQRFLQESRGFAFFLMFRVTYPGLLRKIRGISVRVHETSYHFFGLYRQKWARKLCFLSLFANSFK